LTPPYGGTERKIMSTGFDHSNKGNHLSFDSIDREVRKFDIVGFSSEGAVQTPATSIERLVTVFDAVRPILALSPRRFR
jgi:hypothetical protein